MEIDVKNNYTSAINIGRQGENAVKTVTFDFSSFVEEFGNGILTLIVQRNKDDEPYPVMLSVNGNLATWTITSTDTAYKGTGKIQLSYVVDEQIKKSVIYKIKIEQSIIATQEEPPEPFKTYLEQIVEISSKVGADKNVAVSASESAEKTSNDLHEYAEQKTDEIETTVNQSLADINKLSKDKTSEFQATADEAIRNIGNILKFTDDNNGNITISIGG